MKNFKIFDFSNLTDMKHTKVGCFTNKIIFLKYTYFVIFIISTQRNDSFRAKLSISGTQKRGKMPQFRKMLIFRQIGSTFLAITRLTDVAASKSWCQNDREIKAVPTRCVTSPKNEYYYSQRPFRSRRRRERNGHFVYCAILFSIDCESFLKVYVEFVIAIKSCVQYFDML